ncbi:hypothetical protein P879_11718 [Paragonimus westermani]|uniref:Rhodanese domain-containing protein n=1 Tax=Paragonimus westermani TaxID=34504 RepID=A0A8T0D8V2_9TREM|nr:hypothetical protein P879_11718 [Paragonimus westermani]
MSCVGTRVKQRTCVKHIGKPNGCLRVKSEDVLRRLRQAKSTNEDPQLIIVDVRDARGFQAGHILTALSMSCHTKTMAKRAIVEWDIMFGDQNGCPAPNMNDDSFCTQVSRVSGPSVLIYDQEGSCPFCKEDSSVEFFINTLLTRGNGVYFMDGKFAFHLAYCLTHCY